MGWLRNIYFSFFSWRRFGYISTHNTNSFFNFFRLDFLLIYRDSPLTLYFFSNYNRTSYIFLFLILSILLKQQIVFFLNRSIQSSDRCNIFLKRFFYFFLRFWFWLLLRFGLLQNLLNSFHCCQLILWRIRFWLNIIFSHLMNPLLKKIFFLLDLLLIILHLFFLHQ